MALPNLQLLAHKMETDLLKKENWFYYYSKKSIITFFFFNQIS